MREKRAESRGFSELTKRKSFASSSASKAQIYYYRNMSFVSLLDPCATEFEPAEVLYILFMCMYIRGLNFLKLCRIQT
jgi:hypothetical protein